jgi:FkbM family methyltransferase
LPLSFRAFWIALYVGIEADAEECETLNARGKLRHRYVAGTLGRTRESRTFYITRNPACASLLPPNQPFLSQFEELPESFVVDRCVRVNTISLDDCLVRERIPRVDFLELDTQGSELDILIGAERVLRDHIVGLRVEVEFAPMYVDQPLFADIDAHLRARGFQLFDLSHHHARRAGLDARVATRAQLLWGHAIYLRDPQRPYAAETTARLAVVAALLDFSDVSLALLGKLARTGPSKGIRHNASRAHQALAACVAPTRDADESTGPPAV